MLDLGCVVHLEDIVTRKLQQQKYKHTETGHQTSQFQERMIIKCVESYQNDKPGLGS